MLATEKRGLSNLVAAEQTREKGYTEKALGLASLAIVYFQLENNFRKTGEAYSSHALSERHLWQKTGDKKHLTLALADSVMAVQMASKSKSDKAKTIPLFTLGKVWEDLGNLKEAVKCYREAVNLKLPKEHNRLHVRTDIKMHLATSEYQLASQKNDEKGKIAALYQAQGFINTFEQSKNKIRNDAQRYVFLVWLSGAYMKMAHMLLRDNYMLAKEYYIKARDLIEENNKLLIVRKMQFEKEIAPLFKGIKLTKN